MRPTLHCTNRLFEWAMSLIMLQMGVGVFVADWCGVKIIGAFTILNAMGLHMSGVALLFAIVGSLRCLALYANGKWRNGCYVRAAGCAAGVIVWVQMFAGILIVLLTSQRLFMVLFVWSTFAVFEFASLCRSILDLRSYSTVSRVSENAAPAS